MALAVPSRCEVRLCRLGVDAGRKGRLRGGMAASHQRHVHTGLLGPALLPQKQQRSGHQRGMCRSLSR